MELIPMDVCMLCNENTAVLSSDSLTPYVKYLNNTFFDKNQLALELFQEITADRRFCTLCAHKIVISHKLKDIYEERYKKHTSIKKTRTACFLCESKSCDLVQTDNNPNEFETKIKSFMDATLYPRPYLQCAICFDCLFYLSIWFEMNKHIMDKIIGDTLSKKSPKQMSPLIAHTPTTKIHNIVVIKDKENITPENNNFTMQKEASLEGDSIIETPCQRSKPNSKLNNSVTGNNTDKSEQATTNLNDTLKHLKPISKSSNNTTKLSQNIVKDKKMFDSIPYVLINRCSTLSTSFKHLQPVTRKSSRLEKEIEIIELSDTESESHKIAKNINKLKGKTLTKRISLLKSKIKIKLSSNFIYQTKSASAFSCNICDKVFELNCDYKAHCLWHEKPETIVINITRLNLPKEIESREFNSQDPPRDKKKIEDSKIDSILQKYIDFPNTSENNIEDSECSISKEIQSIIDNLDSQEKLPIENGDESDKSNQETSINKDNVLEQQDPDSTSISNNDDCKKDSDGKQASNSDQSKQIEPELENENHENENPETIVDTEVSSVSENTEQLEAENIDDTTIKFNTGNDDVQPQQELDQAEKIDELELTDNENDLVENNVENIEDDYEENIIEKRLARMHGEEELSKDESCIRRDHEDNEHECSNHLNKSPDNALEIENSEILNGSKIDQIENETEENCDKTNSINDYASNKKRKRVLSLVITDDKSEESSNETEITTPKPKKVRFAMDYQSPNSPEENSASDIILDKGDEDNIKSTDGLLEEIEDGVD